MSSLFGLVPWVNVYVVTRAYGGSEQGGWYYRKYVCEKSVQVWLWDAEVTAARLLRTYEGLAWGILCAEAAGQEVSVRIESSKAEIQSQGHPEYDPEIVVKSVLTQTKPANVISLASRRRIKELEAEARSISKGSYRFVRTARQDEEPCERCEGNGRTPYTHIKGGICFLCGGDGKKSSAKEPMEGKTHVE